MKQNDSQNMTPQNNHNDTPIIILFVFKIFSFVQEILQVVFKKLRF